MKTTTNAYDALRQAKGSSNIKVNVCCQVEDFENSPPCQETVMAYDDDVECFDPDSVEQDLKRKGWVYRYNPDKYGFAQWVCPACNNRATN